MIDMPDSDDLPGLAKWLAQDCQELVGQVIAKHTTSILSELRALVQERRFLRASIAELEAQVREAKAEALEEVADKLFASEADHSAVQIVRAEARRLRGEVAHGDD